LVNLSDERLLVFFADAILLLHASIVIFVVLGLCGIFLGYFLNWRWVRNRVFRMLHLFAIGIVVLQAWLGIVCPLTTWEMALREAAGAAHYSDSFIQHWLHSLLYYSAPDWVFIALYTGFAGLVVISWWRIPPGPRSR